MTNARIRHTDAMATYGERLRAARLAAGYTRADLQRELGVSVSELKRLEDTEVRPSGSRYLARIERQVRFEDQSDPRVSQASEMQLVEALRRRIAARQPFTDDSERRSTFEIVDNAASADLLAADDTAGAVADDAPTEQRGGQSPAGGVRQGGDDGPPPGVVEA